MGREVAIACTSLPFRVHQVDRQILPGSPLEGWPSLLADSIFRNRWDLQLDGLNRGGYISSINRCTIGPRADGSARVMPTTSGDAANMSRRQHTSRSVTVVTPPLSWLASALATLRLIMPVLFCCCCHAGAEQASGQTLLCQHAAESGVTNQDHLAVIASTNARCTCCSGMAIRPTSDTTCGCGGSECTVRIVRFSYDAQTSCRNGSTIEEVPDRMPATSAAHDSDLLLRQSWSVDASSRRLFSTQYCTLLCRLLL